MQTTDNGLLFADLASAQVRSAQMANRLGCDGVNTHFWYELIPLTNGQGCLIVRASGDFGTKPGPTALSQLTPAEIAALQTFAQISPLLPVVARPV